MREEGYLRKYGRLKEDARLYLEKNRIENSLVSLLAASRFAYMNHFGVWSDDEIEGLLRGISDRLFQGTPLPQKTKPDPLKILYIVSYLTDTGGHTEVLRQWIKCLSMRGLSQSLIVTEINNTPTTAGFLKDYDVDVINLPPGETYAERVKMLAKKTIEINPGHIVLLINPQDVIAVTALYHIKKAAKGKMVFIDHSDYSFWLGKPIVDTLVEYMPLGMAVSKQLRGYSGDTVLIPLTTDITEKPSRPLNKAGETVSLSIGSCWKMSGDGEWDYFESIGRILDDNPGHTHMLLTTSKMPSGGLFDGHIRRKIGHWGEDKKSRFRVLYGISDPLPYYRQSDFMIETFPVAGGIVRLEAMACTKSVVFIKNTRCPLLSESGLVPPGYPFIAENNKDVIEYSSKLIREAGLREKYGNALYEHFMDNFSFDRFGERVNALIQGQPLPDLTCGETPSVPDKQQTDYLLRFDRLMGNSIDPYLHMFFSERLRKGIGGRDLISVLGKTGLQGWAALVKAALSRIIRRGVI